MTAHKHAAIFEQTAQEAKTDAKFYEKWEFQPRGQERWTLCHENHLPGASNYFNYRRKQAKPRECLATWNEREFSAGRDPWGGAWKIESKPDGVDYKPIHMIEVTPEVRAALAAAGIEVSQ